MGKTRLEAFGGKVQGANLHLLFGLSLFPIAIDWMGGNHFPPVLAALYGATLLMAALVAANGGRESVLTPTAPVVTASASLRCCRIPRRFRSPSSTPRFPGCSTLPPR